MSRPKPLTPWAADSVGRRLMWAAAALTLLLLLTSLVQVLRTITDPTNTSAPGYLPMALTALGVLVAGFAVAAFIDRVTITVKSWLAWVIGLVSLAAAAVPWFIAQAGNVPLATMLYQGQHVPIGIERFWDLSLVLRSIDCDKWGFNVFVDNNGCLQDASIYAPGVLWLQHVPFSVFSFAHVLALGLISIVLSSLALVWIARQSQALGQFVLLAAAIAAPWLLLLERANVDAYVIWAAILVVWLVRRWPTLWSWSLAAAAIWVVGSWKYYPFVMGLMLLPVLRLRRGWIVLVAWLAASIGYVLATWSNFRFSAQSNSNMIEIGDFVVLGRVPVVARMIGTHVGAGGIQLGDALVFALALAALVWGVLWARGLRGRRQSNSMLAIAGSSTYLASVLVAGFGWGYKAAFLLLTVPLLAGVNRLRGHALLFPALGMLACVAISSVVVWNTLLASLTGIVAASFALGASGSLLVRGLRGPVSAEAPARAS